MGIALASEFTVMANPASFGTSGLFISLKAWFADSSRPLASAVVVSRFQGWPSRALRQLSSRQGRLVSTITRKGSGRFHRRCLWRYVTGRHSC